MCITRVNIDDTQVLLKRFDSALDIRARNQSLLTVSEELCMAGEVKFMGTGHVHFSNKTKQTRHGWPAQQTTYLVMNLTMFI